MLFRPEAAETPPRALTMTSPEPDLTHAHDHGVTPGFRARRALAVAAMLGALAIGLPRFLTHTPYPRFGVVFDWRDAGNRGVIAQVVGPPGRGVLEKGDRLLRIEGETVTRDMLRSHIKKQDWPRGPLRLLAERDGRQIELVLPTLKLSAWQRVRSYTLPLAAVIAVPIVAFLLVWRRPDLGTAWAFLWYATIQGLGAIFDLYRFPPFNVSGGFKLYIDLYCGLTFFYPASFLHFMTVFPRPRWRGPWPLRSVWFWIVVASYVTAPLLFPLGRVFQRRPEDLFVWFNTVALVLGTLSLVERYARPARPEWAPKKSERALALVVALALFAATVFGVFGALGEDPRVSALFSLPLVRVLFTVVIVAWLTSPLLIAFLIANDPAFDPRRLLVRGLPYALLSGVLAALYLAIVLLAQRTFAAATGEEAVAFNVMAALVVAFAFAPLRERLQLWLDRLYGRDPRMLRSALDQAGRELLGALDRDQVRASVEAGLARGLRRSAAIEWRESGPPRLADPGEIPDDAKSAVENLLMQAGIRLENLSLQEQRAAEERRAAELREAATRAELRALHAQVQPHFLFNALNALSYLTETDPRAAQRFTERLADMLRYTVEASTRPAALLSEEIGFVEDYLGVARERYENALAFEYRGSRDLLSVAVPPLLLQPLVENSLKHGCAPGAEALHLTLAARQDDGWLTLEFADDGVAGGNGAKGLGVGLQNLEARMRRFAGSGSSMSAGPRVGGGFQVTLRWRAQHERAA